MKIRRAILPILFRISSFFDTLSRIVYNFRNWLLLRYVPKTAGLTWKPNVPLLQVWKFFTFFVDNLNEISMFIERQVRKHYFKDLS